MPDDQSLVLALPYIQPAQAQKHITHNEALRFLDVIVQLSVQSRTLTAPPELVAEGARYLVPPLATSDWAGRDNQIAVWEYGQWVFFSPLAGFRAHVLDEAETAVFTGTSWVAPSEQDQQFPMLGVNATADGTNRLTVSSAATLFNHDGAGHQLKLNKAAATDTASLLFQTGYSGRAEMGTSGEDDFSIKVSNNGTSWEESLRIPSATGVPVAPLGMTVNGLITGTGITQTQTDTTSGRLMKVGDFGLGGGSSPNCTNLDNSAMASGIYRTSSSIPTTGTWPPTNPTGFNQAGILIVARLDGGSLHQIWLSLGEDSVWRRRFVGGWGAWHRMVRIVGTVSQAGGTATGAIIERGASATGEFVRYADGTQIVTRSGFAVPNVQTADGSIFRSASFDLSMAASFAGTPIIIPGQVSDPDIWISPVSTTAAVATFRLRCATSKGGSGITGAFTAIGRWF